MLNRKYPSYVQGKNSKQVSKVSMATLLLWLYIQISSSIIHSWLGFSRPLKLGTALKYCILKEGDMSLTSKVQINGMVQKSTSRNSIQ